LLQPANGTHKISDPVIQPIRNAILSGLFKPGDKAISEKEIMSQFGSKSENLMKSEEIRYGN
jgi:DNA-binding FadR family transcriptional regulator